MKTADEWKTWNERETDAGVVAMTAQEIIADLAACERARDQAISGEKVTKEIWDKASKRETDASWREWRRWNEKWDEEHKRAEIAEKERAEMEDQYNRWRGAVDISEHEGMRWKDRAEKAEKERDDYKALAEQNIEITKAALERGAGAEAERDALKTENAKLPERWYTEQTMAAVVRERDGIRKEYFKMEQKFICKMDRLESAERELHEEIAHSKLLEAERERLQAESSHAIEVVAGLIAERTRMRDALQALYDEQNGPPLIRYEKRWQAAMDKAAEILKGEP